jgi:phosphoribosylpyrophosphate synthetase
MRARAAQLGGRLEIRAPDDGGAGRATALATATGTMVRARIPLEEA